jgi:hypothetical protein
MDEGGGRNQVRRTVSIQYSCCRSFFLLQGIQKLLIPETQQLYNSGFRIRIHIVPH